MSSEHNIIKKWNKASSEKDFEYLFSLYYAPLCGYALKLVKQKEMSEEVVQNLFLKLWESRQKQDIENIKAYLYRSIYHKCLHLLEHQTIKLKYQQVEKHKPHSYPSPEEGMMMGEFFEAYQSELENLSTNTRHIFLLSRDSNLKYNEIAQQLKISIKTVESHISKALKAFRTRFSEIE